MGRNLCIHDWRCVVEHSLKEEVLLEPAVACVVAPLVRAGLNVQSMACMGCILASMLILFQTFLGQWGAGECFKV